jgi:hypothetical protein
MSQPLNPELVLEIWDGFDTHARWISYNSGVGHIMEVGIMVEMEMIKEVAVAS